MDPEDLALLNRLLGRAPPDPDAPEPTLGQQQAAALAQLYPDVAEALSRSGGGTAGASGLPSDPGEPPLHLLHAQALAELGGANPAPAPAAAQPAAAGLGLPQASPAVAWWPDGWYEPDTMTLGQRQAQAMEELFGPATASPGGQGGLPMAYRDLSHAAATPVAETLSGSATPFSGRTSWQAAYDNLHGAGGQGFLLPANGPPSPRTIGPHGYVPVPDDETLLARMIYAEGRNTPDDLSAIGWATVNRVGAPEFAKTLRQVVDQKNGFQSVPQGGSGPGGSAGWRETEAPSKLTGPNARAWRQSQDVEHGILTGTILDPTGGAPYFFSSPDLDGDILKAARAAPSPWFTGRLEKGALAGAQYQGHIGRDARGFRRNYFAIEPPKKPAS